MENEKIKKVAAFVVGVIFILLAILFYQAYRPKPERLQGQIEARQYSISSKIAGRIADVFVQKGEKIVKGQPVFSLQSPELEAKIKQAEAGEKAAKALANQAEVGMRKQEIAAAKNKWQTAKASRILAEKTFLRVENLYKAGVLSTQKRDEAKAQRDAAKNMEQAAFQLYQMAREGARRETKQAAREKEKMAAGAVAEVKAYAQDLEITSWYDGEVEQVLLHQGELAPQGFPVVTVVDMSDCWAVLHIREDLLDKWKVGTEFDGILPGLGGRVVRFKVSHVAVMGNFATWRSTNIDKDFDMRTFEIEARPLEEIEGLRAGMSVLVER